MTFRKLFYILSSSVLCMIGLYHTASSQNNLSIGDWEAYLPYKNGRLVTQSTDKIYYATTIALLSIDKNTLERREISKIDGLHDVRISALNYDPKTDKLLIAYENTRLDIISDKGIRVVNDILDKSILGDKTIYNIHIHEGIAYLSTGFGIIEYDLILDQFGFFTSTTFRINSVNVFEDRIYASTEDGLYQFDLNSTDNPSNFGLWHFIGVEEGLEPIYNSMMSITISETLYTITDDHLYVLDNSGFDVIPTENLVFKFLFEVDGELGLGLEVNDKIDLYTFDTSSSTLSEIENNCTDSTNDVIQDETGRMWIADEYENIRYIQDGDCHLITGRGPRATNMHNLEFVDDTLYIASGGASDNFTYTFDRSGFYQLADGEWTNYHQYNTPIIVDSSLLNFYTLVKNPITDHLMVGTYWNGILDFDLNDQNGIVYNQYNNTSLEGAIGDNARTRITDMVYDDDDNLWICNYAAADALNVLTPEGIWHSFNLGNNTFISNIVIDDLGYKWMTLTGNNGGVVVYDDGGTIADPTDDRHFEINQGNSLLETGIIHSIHKDDEGDIWVGSDLGPVIFRCGSNVFEGTCEGTTRKVEQDGELAILLATESIRTIATDGGNQKWFGTTNGVFVQSDDGLMRKHSYTAENSPLLDNTIIDLAYDGNNGVMYIATNSGLNAIKTESTSAQFSHSGSATVFPNPVRPDYNGPIAIKGLAKNANIKITDINGNLVYEGESVGGQAIWDGMDYNGLRSSTGIYLVFSSTTDQFRDPDSFVTRIVIVK